MSRSPASSARRKWHPLLKVLLGVATISVVGFVFVRTANDARSEPAHIAPRKAPPAKRRGVRK